LAIKWEVEEDYMNATLFKGMQQLHNIPLVGCVMP